MHNKTMKQIVLGILAHVDAGKTTLSENLLYLCGNIRSMGRVDRKDAYLDSHQIERDRGITIFSKQANLSYEDLQIHLLDTPGHVDFSAEMERTLQVLDYAVLLISAADGVNGHTLTLWRLLKRYEIPTFIFINKMDQQGADKDALLLQIRRKLTKEAFDFDGVETALLGDEMPEQMTEDLASADEELLSKYLDGELETVSVSQTANLIAKRKVFPVMTGSALKSQGVDTLLKTLSVFVTEPKRGENFGATVYKINRDQNTRLTHVKVTGGSLKVRTVLPELGKVNQIRLYSGEKYETVEEAHAGEVCALVGLENTYSGQILGEGEEITPLLEPVLTYRILLPEGVDPMQMLPKLQELEEEEPELHIVWMEETKEIHADLMGDVQTEVLTRIVAERFGVDIRFGTGKILYKETIASTVEGVGHFEPLRHYAEVHLLMEPGERGSGIEITTNCREEDLAKNWQRLIVTHLQERMHRGVLTGSPLTDVKITVVNGRASNKHTEGGDFRQATYRAVRQGLMQAENVLLEPYYAYELRIPQDCVGRAMVDLERMHAQLEPPMMDEQTGENVLCGIAPVSELWNYTKEVTAYTKGYGSLSLNLSGYDVCHNAETVVEERGYVPEADLRHTPDSVFCAHGAGFTVPWYEVPQYMHVESYFDEHPTEEEALSKAGELAKEQAMRRAAEGDLVGSLDMAMGYEEVDTILREATHANTKSSGNQWKHEKGKRSGAITRSYETREEYEKAHKKAEAATKKKYLLVDGYNVVFAWKELAELARDNIDGARGRLLDILCNYQALIGKEVIVVFDAYRLQNHATEYLDYHNIHVVYTKTAETADRYIERFAHNHHEQYDVAVATSDGMEQIIIRGQGCELISSRDLEKDVNARAEQAVKAYLKQ